MSRLMILVLVGAVWITLSEGIQQAPKSHKRHVTRRIMAGPAEKGKNIFLRSLPHGRFRALARRGMDNQYGTEGHSKCIDPGACSGNGDCLDYGYYAEDYKGYTCQCFDGYVGDKCEYEDVCEKPENANICQNGGVCYPDFGENPFWCACEEGYTGQYCESKCELAKCFSEFYEDTWEESFNLTTYETQDIDEATCGNLVGNLKDCIAEIQADGESVCGCDEWDIGANLELQENPDKLMQDHCYNNGYECEDPEVDQCAEKVQNAYMTVYPIMHYKKRETPANKEAAVTDAVACLQALQRRRVAVARGCSWNQWLLDLVPERFEAELLLVLNGCPLLDIAFDCVGQSTFCNDGNIDHGQVEDAKNCIRKKESEDDKCTGASAVVEPTEAELQQVAEMCAHEKKISEFKARYQCPVPAQLPERVDQISFGMKKTLTSLVERIKKTQKAEAEKNERENRIKLLTKLLKRALETE